MSRVVVLGVAGMLGHKVLQHLSQSYETVGTMRGAKGDAAYRRIPLLQTQNVIDDVDASDFVELKRLLRRVAPDVVVNCVGVIKQRPAAKNPIPSITINSLLPHVLAEQTATTGARLLHFSTDCVFSGRQGSYTEDDPSDADDLYGQTKYLGEVTDRAHCLTLRTSIIGRELMHFQSLVEWFLSQPEGTTVHGFRRALYSGVTTNYMAALIETLLDKHPELSGLFHLAGPATNKFDLLECVKRHYGHDVEIKPSDEVAIDRTLRADRFMVATGISPPSWDSMIGDMAADATPYEEWR